MNAAIKRIIDYFNHRDEVSVLYVFGSYGSRKETKESDIDIALLIDETRLKKTNFATLKKTYYSASPTFSIRPVDIVILNTAPSFLKYHILKTGRVLYDKNRSLRIRFATQTIIEYLDYKPIEDICLKAVANRFRRKLLVDKSLINRKLERVDNYLKQIRSKKDPGFDLFAKDIDLQSIILFNLIQAIQACIDIGAHIISDSEWETPGTLASIFEVLSQNKVISKKLAEKMIQMAGFRNRIVHEYEKIDLEIVHTVWRKSLDDIEEFCRSVVLKFNL